MLIRFRPLISLSLLALLIAGCGKATDPNKLQVVPATGVLSIPDTSAEGFNLLFVPEDLKLTNAWCQVDKDGQFRVSTYEQGDGIAAGRYTVVISDGAGVMPGEDTRLKKIPMKYRSPESSPWKVEITNDAKQNVINLKVE